jgi:hypothetical protein
VTKKKRRKVQIMNMTLADSFKEDLGFVNEFLKSEKKV